MVLDTSYMVASCNLTGIGDDLAEQNATLFNTNMRQADSVPGSSGANYNFTWPGSINGYLYGTPWGPTAFDFFSMVTESSLSGGSSPEKPLTRAQCLITMSYIQAEVRCDGPQCGAPRVRPLQDFWKLLHVPVYGTAPQQNNAQQYINSTALGMNSGGDTPSSFFTNLARATNPRSACATVHCGTSVIEAYLADPLRPFATGAYGSPILWEVDETVFSRRMSQLLNTYWIPNIAPYAITGNFSIEKSDCEINPCAMQESYNIDSSMGTVSQPYTALKCNYEWLVILFTTSTLLLLLAIASLVLSLARRGPDLLDCFSTILKDNKYVDIPDQSSLDDAAVRSRLLKDIVIRFGDVKADGDAGYAAYSVLDEAGHVLKLKPRRYYI